MVNNLIRNGKDFLFRRQTNILSAATIIAGAVLLSRSLGLIRFRLLTDRFSVADIGLFLAAFRLPNTIFDLIVMGALTTAFIPVFTSYLSRGEEDQANAVASTIFNLSAIAAAVLGIVFLIFTPQIVRFIVPGLSEAEIATVIPFTRIMLAGQVFPLVLGNFLTGVLQSHKRFLLPALAPVAYNLGIILGILFLSPTLGLYGAVWGVVFGAILFLAIQVPLFLHLHFRYHPSILLSHAGVREVGKLIGPRTIGLAVNQINYTVILTLSSLFSARGITIFTFAQQLAQLPVGIFANPISQAALPTLSEERSKQDNLEAFRRTFLTSFHQILFLILPAAVILIVLRIPVVRLVYGASRFDWPATVETGRTLAFLGVGLVAESLTILLIRGFYALSDSKTPVIISGLSVGLNIFLAVLLTQIFHLPIWGLAAASAIADLTLVLALLAFFFQKIGRLELGLLLVPAAKMLLAAFMAGIFLYIPMKLLDQLVFDTTRTMPLIMLTGTATLTGLSAYFFLTWVLEISELRAFLGLFGRMRRVLFAAEETVEGVVNEAIVNP